MAQVLCLSMINFWIIKVSFSVHKEKKNQKRRKQMVSYRPFSPLYDDSGMSGSSFKFCNVRYPAMLRCMNCLRTQCFLKTMLAVFLILALFWFQNSHCYDCSYNSKACVIWIDVVLYLILTKICR